MRTRIFILMLTLAAALPSWGAGAAYTYDAAGRLIRVDYGGKGFAYTYDNNGNLLSRTAFESSRRRPVRRVSQEKRKTGKTPRPAPAIASLR
jgi:YD repeat-containing protein